MGFLAVVSVALGLVHPVPGAPESRIEEQVVATLSAYHAAFAAGDADAVVGLLGPSLFMADRRTDGEAPGISAHAFRAGEALASWPSAFLEEAGPYRNRFRVVSVSTREDLAVVRTRDTGSNKFRNWEDEEVVWFLGRVSGEWRIVGFVIHDIQLPSAP